MATIVCLKRGIQYVDTEEYSLLEVVDGQQRLTTIILILNAIKLILEPKNRRSERTQRELNDLLVKEDGDNLLLLQTNHDSNHLFSNYIRNGVVSPIESVNTFADKNLVEAMNECNEFVRGWIESGNDLVDLYGCLKNRLSFVLHVTEDEKLVYSVFEILNSRGIAVSWLARLKSALMGRAFDLGNRTLIKDLHNIWSKVYSQVGLHHALNEEVLRFAATLYAPNKQSRRLSEKDSVLTLSSRATSSKNIREVANWILRVAQACAKVRSNKRHLAVTRVYQSRLLAVAIHLTDDLSDRSKKDIFKLWEKVVFRAYGMMETDARRDVGPFVGLAWEIMAPDTNTTKRYIEDRLLDIGKDYPIDVAVDCLRAADCYHGWQEELRYFLMRYEEHLARGQGNRFNNEQWNRIWEASTADSIEHIFPQSDDSRNAVMHNIGNLIILPPRLNSTLLDKPPREKFDAYIGTGLLHAIEVAAEGRWTNTRVKERESKLLRWAKKEWSD